MQPFLALITPIGGGPVDPGYGVPGWPSHPIAPGGPPPRPTHPIYYPPGIWGGGGVGDYIDAGFPGPQPGRPPQIWGGPYEPPRPWGPLGPYIDAGFPGPQPGQPPRPWGPINYPDQGLPGPQPPGTPPLTIWGPIGDYIDAGFPGPQPGRPPRPTHPIYFPPVIWDPSRPANPIVNPGDPDHPGPAPAPKIEWKTAWSPSTGWVVVGVPTGEHVTPSAVPPVKK